MTTKLMGQKVQRVEDQRFLRGQGRYVDDVAIGAATLHAAVLRSPHAHARIVDIDVSEVLDVEGVHAVWTYDDLSGPMAEPLPLLIPHPALTHGRTQYALAKDEVNYVGEAIAFVVAEDRYVAEDAVSRIRVDYEFLTPVEVCVELHAVIRLTSGSQRATTPRPSIGWHELRSMVRSRASRCGAPAMAAGASPTFCSSRAPMLPGTSSCTSRSAARASGMPITTGSGS